MKLRLSFIFVFFLVTGAGCLPWVVDKNKNVITQDSDSAITEYKDGRYNFSFYYLEKWGKAEVRNQAGPLDLGQRIIVTFADSEYVRVVFFSDDFREGVQEGSPLYFNSQITTNLSDVEIKDFLKEKTDFAKMDVEIVEKLSAEDQIFVRAIGSFGYGEFQPAIFYLLPDFFKDRELRHVMVVGILNDYNASPYTVEQLQRISHTEEFISIDAALGFLTDTLK